MKVWMSACWQARWSAVSMSGVEGSTPRRMLERMVPEKIEGSCETREMWER